MHLQNILKLELPCCVILPMRLNLFQFTCPAFSVTIVVAYLMKNHGMSLSQALAHVKSRRRQAGPNSGFISQLRDFEKSLQGASFLILLNLFTCKLYLTHI